MGRRGWMNRMQRGCLKIAGLVLTEWTGRDRHSASTYPGRRVHMDFVLKEGNDPRFVNPPSMTKLNPIHRLHCMFGGIALVTAMLVCGAVPSFGQGTLAELRKRGELVIATDATYPPFEYIEGKAAKASGTPIGFDVEIGNAVAQELGVKARWVVMEWSGVLPSLNSGKS